MAEPVAYMARTRAWYLALGYDNPFIWAHHADAPFARLSAPLSQTTVAIVTTAAPCRPDAGDQGPGAPYNGDAKFFDVYALPASGPVDLRISHIAYDRTHTSAGDPGTWLPLEALRRAASAGRIGAVASHVFGLPTVRSRRTTIETHAPDLLARLGADGAGAAILVPNCPVCHQCVSLAARHLEEAGIATVVMGCARDIVEHCAVPRFVFSDFPLGNAAGRPGDPRSQDVTLALALDLLESARAPMTTVMSPLRWSTDDAWKADYSNPENKTPAELAAARAAFDAGKRKPPGR